MSFLRLRIYFGRINSRLLTGTSSSSSSTWRSLLLPVPFVIPDPPTRPPLDMVKLLLTVSMLLSRLARFFSPKPSSESKFGPSDRSTGPSMTGGERFFLPLLAPCVKEGFESTEFVTDVERYLIAPGMEPTRSSSSESARSSFRFGLFVSTWPFPKLTH